MAQEIYHRSEWGNPTEQWGNVYLNADLTNELYKRASEYENSWVTDQLLNGVGTKPSIILTPTAYEDGLLNSVKPKGGENLLTYSEDFSQWATSGTITVESGYLAPDGSTNAYKITDNAPSNNATALFLVGVATASNSRTIYAKTVSGTGTANLCSHNSNTNNLFTVTNKWQRFEVNNTTSATGETNFYGIDFRGSGTLDEIIIWGAQLERGSQATAYIKTNGTAYKNGDFDFTRGSSATRVNEKGLVQDVQILSGELVQNGDFEQIGSEVSNDVNFDNPSNWSLTGQSTVSNGKAHIVQNDASNTGITANTTITNKTYKITGVVSDYVSGSVGFASLGSTNPRVAIPSENGAFTIYYTSTRSTPSTWNIQRITSPCDLKLDNVSVKEVGQNWSFGTGWSMGDGVAVFDTTSNSSFITNLNISSGNLYRLKIEGEVTSGNIKLSATSGLGNGQAISLPFEQEITHDGGANTVEIRTIGSAEGFISNVSVIEITDDTDLPRINYTNFDYENGEVVPYSGEGSLLLENQSTNKITYSEDFSQWTKAGGTSVESGYTAPDGSNNAYKVSGTSSSSLYLASVTNTTDTRTIWAKTLSGSGDVYLCGNLNDADALFTVNTQWQRFELNGFTGGGATTFYAVDFRGSSTLTELIIWGAQAEALSYATSYIPTNGSTVTRLADVCNNSGNSDLINSTEGVLYAEISALSNDGNYKAITLSDGTVNNQVLLALGNSDNTITWEIRSNNITSVFTSYSQNILQFNKIAIKFKTNDFALWLNGNEVMVDNIGSSPTGMNVLDFQRGDGALDFYGNVKCVAVFKEALSDTELQKLTTI